MPSKFLVSALFPKVEGQQHQNMFLVPVCQKRPSQDSVIA